MSTDQLPRQASWPFFAEFCAPTGMAGISAGSNHQLGSLEVDGRGFKVPTTRVRKSQDCWLKAQLNESGTNPAPRQWLRRRLSGQ